MKPRNSCERVKETGIIEIELVLASGRRAGRCTNAAIEFGSGRSLRYDEAPPLATAAAEGRDLTRGN